MSKRSRSKAIATHRPDWSTVLIAGLAILVLFLLLKDRGIARSPVTTSGTSLALPPAVPGKQYVNEEKWDWEWGPGNRLKSLTIHRHATEG